LRFLPSPEAPWFCIIYNYGANTVIQQMKGLRFDLLAYLNSFLDADTVASNSQVLEELLSGIEKEALSMHDFLEVLINTNVWQGWQIEPNPYKPLIISVGREIDRIASLHQEPAFHSKKHMIDVCLMLSYLLRNEESQQNKPISQAWETSLTEKWQLLLAAAAHDLGHPGLINNTPHEIEQQSLDILKAILNTAQIEPRLMSNILDSVAPWILATDHGQYKALLERLAIHPPEHVDCLAMLLVEADLASSVLPVRGKLLAGRLSDEWSGPYPEKSIALRNQVGYLSFLDSLQFVSPQADSAGIPQILNNSLIQLRTQLS
jgi:3'5'-cyclic nucleotide phosphodiesterase